MANTETNSPLKKYGIVIVLALAVLLVAILGGARILARHPQSPSGIDRSATEASAGTSQSGLDAVTKNNVEDTSMTVN